MFMSQVYVRTCLIGYQPVWYINETQNGAVSVDNVSALPTCRMQDLGVYYTLDF